MDKSINSQSFTKISVQTPVSVLIHGANQLGFLLAKTISSQGSRVIVIDHFDKESKKFISELKKLGSVDFIDFDGIEPFFQKIARVDYLYYLQYSSLLANTEFSSREFLEESNYLNLAIKSSLKFNAKFSIITTILLNKQLAYQSEMPSYVTPSPYSNIEMQKYSETLTAEYYDKSNANVRIIRIGAIMGKDFTLDEYPTLHQLYTNAVKDSQIIIKGEGLETHHIIHQDDAIYGLLKLGFSEKTRGEVISLCNNNDYTTLSIAYKLLELNPTATGIKFEQDPTQKYLIQSQYLPAPNAEKFDWKPSIALEQIVIEQMENYYEAYKKKWDNKPDKEKDIRKQLDKINSGTNTVQVLKTPLGKFIDKITSPFTKLSSDIKEKRAKGESISFKTLLIFVITFGLLFYFILGPIITIGVTGLLSYQQSKKALENISNFDFAKGAQNLEKVEKYTDRTIDSINSLQWAFAITKQNALFDNISQLAGSANIGATGAKNTLTALVPLGLYLKEFEPAVSLDQETPTTTREYSEYLKQIEKNKPLLTKSSQDIILSLQMIENIDTSVFPQFLQGSIADLKITTQQISTIVEPAREIVNFLPAALGLEERQYYLLLLQNPGELRSTGGWISSYAVISIEGGQIREIYVDDVYNLEGQLRSQGKFYMAPEKMQQALQIKNWSLSLSNWETDFDQSAQSAEFFFKQAGEIDEFDGVISINISFIQRLLDTWGGIELPNEKEVITSENIYDKIFELHSEFAPGESVKSEFLSKLAQEAITKLLSSDFAEYKKISEALLESLYQKDILLYMKNQEANRYFAQMNWDGDFGIEYLSSPSIVEWNWGANKANLFIRRNEDLKINIQSEQIMTYEYSVSSQNTSDSKAYPEGDYVNYARIYLPENASISSVAGFDNSSYTTYYSQGFLIIAGYQTVPIMTTKNLTVTYSLTQLPDQSYFPITYSGNIIKLDLVHFKQPGLLNSSINTEITYPENWNAIKYEGLNKVSNFLSVKNEFTEDQRFEIEFTK